MNLSFFETKYESLKNQVKMRLGAAHEKSKGSMATSAGFILLAALGMGVAAGVSSALILTLLKVAIPAALVIGAAFGLHSLFKDDVDEVVAQSSFSPFSYL